MPKKYSDEDIFEFEKIVLKSQTYFMRSQKEITELQAHINILREALEKAMNDDAGWFDLARLALTSTPARSLQAHDDEVIERCAETAYDWVMAYVVEDTAPISCYDAIRALKGTS